MMGLGTIGYVSATLIYSLLAVLLVVSWRGGRKGGLFFGAIVMSLFWAGSAAYSAYQGEQYFALQYQLLTVAHYVLWYLFLYHLLVASASLPLRLARRLLRAKRGVLLFSVVIVLYGAVVTSSLTPHAAESSSYVALITLWLFLPIIGLVIIEQLVRNYKEQSLWAIKYLFIGLGLIFIYDFFLYSHAILFNGIDPALWEIRGYVHVCAAPLLAIAAARNRDWQIELFVSREVVFHSTTIVGGGLYLLLMSAVGYYLQEVGGSWGGVLQAVFLSLSLALLVIILFSAQLRAKLRVFISKHFYQNKYDYRFEWLRLTRDLKYVAGSDRYESPIHVLAQIVECRSGMLWLSSGSALENVGNLNWPKVADKEPNESPFIRFMREKGYIINVAEVNQRQEEYLGLVLPEWLQHQPLAWLVVPLFTPSNLLGFVVLCDPLVVKEINWEDRDLLKTAAQQVANHLELLVSSEFLAEAKQFEAFNRLSAYMVHDLKNIGAELELVGRNADKHRNNAAFLDDVFATVKNAAGEINRLLNQLRGQRATEGQQVQVFALESVIKTAINKVADRRPVPIYEASTEPLHPVRVEKERLTVMLRHLLNNAQEATTPEGEVKITLASDGNFNIIRIEDNGIGMSGEFVRDRLFKPFDTTKGNAGMGIGMYESREFIRSIGGEIRVHSEEGLGTVVDVCIPVYDEDSRR